MTRLRTSVRLLAAMSLGAAMMATTAGPASAVAARPVTLAMLKSAPVPSLCDHPAGHLVNGSLPGIPAQRGFVMIPAVTGEAHGNSAVVFGDLNGDGVRDAAVTVWCNQGGVPWPDSVQLYTSGAKRLGGISLEKISHGDRDFVRSMRLVDGVVTVHWSTNRDTDFGCCSTLDYAAQLHMKGAKFVVSHATPYDERPALHALFAALKKNSPTLTQLANAATVTQLRYFQQAGQLSGTWHCYGAPDADQSWPADLLYALGSSPTSLDTPWEGTADRYCVTTTPDLVTLVRLQHEGYRRWLADYTVQGSLVSSGDE